MKKFIRQRMVQTSARGVKLRKQESIASQVQDQGNNSEEASSGLTLSLSRTLLAPPSQEVTPSSRKKNRSVISPKNANYEVPAQGQQTIEPNLTSVKSEVAGIEPKCVPQLVASGRKRAQRGRKRIISSEIEGWGIYNREASHLVRSFFSRKTDVINHLEDTVQEPWAKIKTDGKFTPVRITIFINEDDMFGSVN